MIDVSAGRAETTQTLKELAKAHADVASGIATHAENVRVQRESNAEKMDMQRQLSQPTGGIGY